MKRGLGMQALEMEVRVSEKGTQGRQAGLACRLSFTACICQAISGAQVGFIVRQKYNNTLKEIKRHRQTFRNYNEYQEKIFIETFC